MTKKCRKYTDYEHQQDEHQVFTDSRILNNKKMVWDYSQTAISAIKR